MIFTSYADREPFASDLKAARRAMTIEDQVEMEEALQRWSLWGPEPAHVYARLDGERAILARQVYGAGRWLIAVQDARKNEIVVVAMAAGRVGKALQAGFDWLGIDRRTVATNLGWRGEN